MQAWTAAGIPAPHRAPNTKSREHQCPCGLLLGCRHNSSREAICYPWPQHSSEPRAVRNSCCLRCCWHKNFPPPWHMVKRCSWRELSWGSEAAEHRWLRWGELQRAVANTAGVWKGSVLPQTSVWKETNHCGLSHDETQQEWREGCDVSSRAFSIAWGSQDSCTDMIHRSSLQ